LTSEEIFDTIRNGDTAVVVDYLAKGNAATSADRRGVSLIRWCAYYGDVTAVRTLLDHGEKLESLGENYDLNGAAFHGYWRLCKFLIDRGADVNYQLPETGETALHSAITKVDRSEYLSLVKVLLDHAADPSIKTKPGVETDAFMRDCRTKGETPLHRAAAFAPEDVIKLLLDAGARREEKDMHGDTPLSWASWYLRPRSILRLLCYGNYTVRV
jgi:ankyrin repeat protein